MDNLTATAASGMRSRLQALDILANNMANASSRGYKADREMYSLYAAADARDANTGAGQTQPWIHHSWTDFSQGILQPTGDPLDVALVGNGFLSVRGAMGTVYTRNGSLRVSPTGELLAVEDRPVLDANNQPIRVDPSRPLEIDASGTLKQGGNTLVRLGVVEFPKPEELVKAGQSYFHSPGAGNSPRQATGTEVRQGQTESSNAGSAESAVRLVTVLRQFEMLQRAISLGSEMNRHAIEEVGKVTP